MRCATSATCGSTSGSPAWCWWPSLFFALTRLEVIAVLVAISFVLITEMLNTAIEHLVDLVTDQDDPRAKVAKDVAAGAVLIAAVNAVAVAYLVFYDKITSVPYTVLTKLRGSPIDVTVIALVIVILAAIAMKALTHRGTAFRGGLPSAHAAVAFAAWVAVTFVAANTGYALPISAIALFMALLVAQSRIQAGIHSLLEVAVGAALGIVITARPLPPVVPAVNRAPEPAERLLFERAVRLVDAGVRALLGVRRGRRRRRPLGPRPSRRQRRERLVPGRSVCGTRCAGRHGRLRRALVALCRRRRGGRAGLPALRVVPAGAGRVRRSVDRGTRAAARCVSCSCSDLLSAPFAGGDGALGASPDHRSGRAAT